MSSYKLQAVIFSLPVFLASLFLFPYFTGGDQVHYRLFYDGVLGRSPAEAFSFYSDTLGTSEPGYFFLIYFFSGFVSKDILLSLINFLFTYFIFLWLLINRVRFYILPLLLLNFYFLVLLFSAERLKLSLLFFLISYFSVGVIRYVLYAFSLFSHVQVLMLFASIQSKRLIYFFRRFLVGRVAFDFLPLFFSFFLGGTLVVFLWGHISAKFIVYHELWSGWGALIKPLLFTCLAMYYAKGKCLEALLASAPMVVASFLIGAERVVMFSYFVFMFYSLRCSRGVNFGVIAFSFYFLWRGIIFLYNIINYGDGFFFVD